MLINWITGKPQPAWRCLETTSKGRVELCSYPITVDAHRDATEPTFVRLFPKADDGYTPQHVIVQPQTKIDHLEPRVESGCQCDLVQRKRRRLDQSPH